MPISAQQWRAVVGSNNVRSPHQVGVKRFNLLDLLSLDQEHKGYRLLAALGDECFKEPAVIVVICACLMSTQVLLGFVSMVAMLLLLLAGDVETNPGPGTDTPEYLTIVECTSQLVSFFKHDLWTLSDQLWQKGMLSEGVREKLSDSSFSKPQKANALIDYITDRVKNAPTPYYQTFVQIVKNLGPWAKDLTEHLEETYSDKCKAVKSQATPAARGVSRGAQKMEDQVTTSSAVKLTMDHLEAIKNAIWEARNKWKDIGGGLKVPYSTLGEITFDLCLRNDGQRLGEVLLHWIQTDKATIHDLLKVLRGKIVHRVDIANRITALQGEEKIAVGLVAEEKIAVGLVAADPGRKTPPDHPATIDHSFSEPAVSETKHVHECTENVVFCVQPDIDPPERQSSVSSVDPNAEHAQVAPHKLWPSEQDVLFVCFLNPDALIKVGLQAMLIMEWARKWELPSNRGIVPRFKETHNKENANIRVKFGNGGSWSRVGTDAISVTNTSKPTMMLSLYKGQADFNRHTVIHEFGHVLGLEHEHQRSMFWRVASDLIDVEKMQKDRRLSNTSIFNDYLECQQCGSYGSEEYDPDSIMHYWFDKKWLKHPHHRELRHVNSMPVGCEVKKILLGIHKRHKKLAEGPSDTDYNFLAECYRTNSDLNEPIIAQEEVEGPSLSGSDQNEPIIAQEEVGGPSQPGSDQNAPIMAQEGGTGLSLPDSNENAPIIAQENGGGQLPPAHDQNATIVAQEEGGDHIGMVPKLIVKESSEEEHSLQERDTGIAESVPSKQHTIKIGVIGATNSGKSTTLNALLRRKFLPYSSGSTTAHVLCIKHYPSIPNGELYKILQGRSELLASGKDDIYRKLEELNDSQRAESSSGGQKSLAKLELRVNIPVLSCLETLKCGVNFELYDTPGTSEDEESQIYKDAKQVQDQMGHLILVLSQDTALHRETTDLLTRLRERFPRLMSHEKLIVLMNKYDLFFDKNIKKALADQKHDISRKLQVDLNQIMFYSAKIGLEARSWQADFESVDEDEYDELKFDIKKMPGMKDEVKKLETLQFEEKVKQLSELGENSSCICAVETHIITKCSIFAHTTHPHLK